MTLELQIAGYLLCVSASAFFAGIETGVISMNRLRLLHRARLGSRNAKLLSGYLREPDRLLGTTLGMLQAFGSIAQDVLVAAKPVILAQGVSKAIVTTIAGLMVAIPCMLAYAIFRRRVTRLAGRLEAASAEIVTAIAARRGLRK